MSQSVLIELRNNEKNTFTVAKFFLNGEHRFQRAIHDPNCTIEEARIYAIPMCLHAGFPVDDVVIVRK